MLSVEDLADIEDPASRTQAKELILLPGGSGANPLLPWRLHGPDQSLRSAWQAGMAPLDRSRGSTYEHLDGGTAALGLTRGPLTNGPGNRPYCGSAPERRGEERVLETALPTRPLGG